MTMSVIKWSLMGLVGSVSHLEYLLVFIALGELQFHICFLKRNHFVFDRTGSSLLCVGFLSCGELGLFSS